MRLRILLLAVACVVLLAAAPPALAVDYTADQCVACHSAITPGVVSQFQQGVMSGQGVTCVSCHGGDHDAIFAAQGRVPASKCAGCHPDQYAEFAHKDASGVFTEKHAIGWTRMTAAARYTVMPPEERYEMCERCHNIGYVAADGSVGKCDSCHTRHTFSKQEALEPEACGTCHMGPDHEQIDMWQKSKHGVVYTTERGRAGGDPGRAPTCVTCHMPEGTDAGGKPAGQPLVHDVSTNITLGTVAQGAEETGAKVPVTMRALTANQIAVNRGRMEALCQRCHASGFVERNLQGADEIKRDVDQLLWDPVMRIRGLWYDGLLDPMPVNRPANPVFGQVLVLGGQQLYGGTSAVEQLFFTTYKYDHVSTFKGAYHMNPDYSHWYGWSRVMQDRDLIKGEEARLRRVAMSDPGFSVSSRATVGAAVKLDASALAAWGDASANTYEWGFGDGQSVMPAPSPTLSHIYTKSGRYTVQLTCADSDLLNDPAQPTASSAKRTTSLAVLVKNGASLKLAEIKPVAAGAKVSIKGKLTTGDASSGSVALLVKGGDGWKQVASHSVKTAAGTILTVKFSRKLTKKTTFKLAWSGDVDTWDAKSGTRTVKPR